MTALKELERLEAPGQWRADPQSPPREVVVSVGEATLILSDPRTEHPLSHWSLPAVTRLNPGRMPARYTPRPEEPDELLEIDDQWMIDAIERVERAVQSHRAHPGRLRGLVTLLAVLAMIGGLALWLPDALVRHAARVAPPAQARTIGEAVLAELSQSNGMLCSRASGQAVLDWLAPRLLAPDAAIRVLPVLNTARRLPGNLFVLGADLLEPAPGPEAAAGHLLAASVATDADQALRDALDYAGPKAALRLLTLGSLPQGALSGYAAQLLASQPARPEDEVMLDLFAQKKLPSTPYARSLDPTGESVLGLIEADPLRDTPPARPLLTPPQWDALRLICAG